MSFSFQRKQIEMNEKEGSKGKEKKNGEEEKKRERKNRKL